jgi:hypothetical protein
MIVAAEDLEGTTEQKPLVGKLARKPQPGRTRNLGPAIRRVIWHGPNVAARGN